MTHIYEKLGLFYLGKRLDPATGEPTGLLELIKNKNLTTHAAIIGMTGSGKTGLGIAMLEEAAIDKIPVIAIDPKGDLGNICLAFEDFDPKKFEPWIDPQEAQKEGLNIEEYAKRIAKRWEEGIQSFHQDRDRIKRLKESAEFLIYTPGSSAGIPLSILSSFEAPSKEILEDTDSYTYMLASNAASLLALVGIEEKDSSAFILVSNILDHFWRQGKSLTIEEIIASIITPPFKKIGVLPLEGFYPRADRMKLALKFNNLISAPSFQNWITGEPLDIAKLLHNEEGKPKISILYLAHLNDQERMFFVTLLLSRLISWMRRQSGTNALRALLYMDEIFGYFPPNANPPSKEPMLLLLKQARAFGIGAVLSTQNPVDIDYKGLANIGMWFLGRLQTRQDIDRVIDGLLKNSPDALDKKEIQEILSNLPKRTFLLRSIHKEELELFTTRWVLSYLKGPLSKDEVRRLMDEKKPKSSPSPSQKEPQEPQHFGAPILSEDIPQRYEIVNPSAPLFRFRPFLYFHATLHFYNQRKGIDLLQKRLCEIELFEYMEQIDFAECQEAEAKERTTHPPSNASFATLPPFLMGLKNLKSIEKEFRDHLYLNERITLFRVKKLRLESELFESYEEFKERLLEALRDKKEEAIEKIEKRYEAKLLRLQKKLQRAYVKLEKEKEEAKSKTTDTLISLGMTLLDSLFGRKKVKSSTIAKAGSTISKAKRAYEEHNDIKIAQAQIDALEEEIALLQEELEKELEEIEERFDPINYPIEEIAIKPRKSDLKVQALLLWKQI